MTNYMVMLCYLSTLSSREQRGDLIILLTPYSSNPFFVCLIHNPIVIPNPINIRDCPQFLVNVHYLNIVNAH